MSAFYRRYDRYLVFFFFNDTATTEIYTLSLHDALPISNYSKVAVVPLGQPNGPRYVTSLTCERVYAAAGQGVCLTARWVRSEEHTSELQSRQYLVCRLLLEKKKHSSIRHT